MKKRKIFGIVLVLLLAPFIINAQVLNPVHWSFSKKDLGDSNYIIHLTAKIDPGWHIYAQDAGEGPIPTSFTFEKDDQITLKGKVRGVGKLQKDFDKAFNSVLKFYEKKVDFVQYVSAKSGAKSVKGSLTYMVCDDHQCLPPKDVEFKITL